MVIISTDLPGASYASLAAAQAALVATTTTAFVALEWLTNFVTGESVAYDTAFYTEDAANAVASAITNRLNGYYYLNGYDGALNPYWTTTADKHELWQYTVSGGWTQLGDTTPDDWATLSAPYAASSLGSSYGTSPTTAANGDDTTVTTPRAWAGGPTGPTKSGHQAVWDSDLNRMLIYGGYPNNIPAELWQYTVSGGWVQLTNPTNDEWTALSAPYTASSLGSYGENGPITAVSGDSTVIAPSGNLFNYGGQTGGLGSELNTLWVRAPGVQFNFGGSVDGTDGTALDTLWVSDVITGSITSVSGTVTVTLPDQSVVALTKNTPILAGEIITTGSSSYVQFEMVDGFTATLQPDTQVAVKAFTFSQDAPQNNNLVMDIITGFARFVTGLVGGASVIQLPTAAIGIRGTDFSVQVTSDGDIITVYSGEVIITNQWGVLLLHAGQRGISSLTGPPRLILDNVATPLRAGIYQYAVTYLRNDDQESGARKAGTIELLHPGGIFLSPIATSLDPTVTHKIIYCTSVGGETLYKVGIIDNETTTFLIDTIRPGASPLLTQFLSPPPAGDYIAYWKGWLLVAKDNRLYVSEPYAPELFDLRKSYPFLDPITMVAALNNRTDGIWVGTTNQVVWLEGGSPEEWKPNPAADYGVIPHTLALFDGDQLGDGSSGGDTVAYFATTHGFCLGKSDGSFTNTSQSRFAYPVQATGAGIIRRHRGTVQYVVTMQGAEVAGNVFA
jgi:hypothetical protein